MSTITEFQRNHMDDWVVEDVGARVAARIVNKTTGAPIASLGGGQVGGNNRIHDFDHLVSVRIQHARLMASAPELLNALQDLMANHKLVMMTRAGYSSEQVDGMLVHVDARAAIAKATGEQ